MFNYSSSTATSTHKVRHNPMDSFLIKIDLSFPSYNYNYNSHLKYAKIQDKIVQQRITESIELRQ